MLMTSTNSINLSHHFHDTTKLPLHTLPLHLYRPKTAENTTTQTYFWRSAKFVGKWRKLPSWEHSSC